MVPRVLMLGWGFPPNVSGGLDTAVGELYAEFDERETVEIDLVLPAEYAPDGVANIHGVPTGDGDVSTRINRLAGEFVDMAADANIVHTHDWFGYGPGSRAQGTHDVSWVTTFHSLTVDRNRHPPEREVETEQRIADRADHLIAVSDVVRRTVRHEYGRESRVIHNGFTSVEPTGRDIKAELGLETMLFFVGRHTDQKGISHLLYAMSKLRRDDVTLVVGGTGHLTEQLKQFVSLLGIEDQVVFVGYVPQEELGDYYDSADVFVSPSLAEPFGITIVEALSVGTHVVASESGAAEVLPDGCIIEVEPDSDSIAAGIETALEGGPIPEYEPRTWATVADEHVEFYTEILTSEAVVDEAADEGRPR